MQGIRAQSGASDHGMQRIRDNSSRSTEVSSPRDNKMCECKALRTTRRLRAIDDRIVTLRCGSGHEISDFAVHEAILRAHSPFFNTALDKKWREGMSRQVELPEEEVECVASYVDWLYFKQIPSMPTSPPDLPVDDGEYLLLAQLYSLGDRLQDDTFCDAVLDAMIAKTDDIALDGTRTFPSHSAITALYNGTPAGSPARAWVVDMYVEYGAQKWISDEAACNNHEFLTDLTKALLAKRERHPFQKHSNFPRRHKWHKIPEHEEFLKIARPQNSLATLS